MKTLHEAVQFIVSKMAPDDIAAIREALGGDASPETMITRAHHGFGTHVRNTLKLWQDESADLRQDIWNHLTPERQDFYRKWWLGKGDHEGRTMHADDASHSILDAVLQHIATTK